MPSPYSVDVNTIFEVRYLMRYFEQRCMTVLHYAFQPGQTSDPEGVSFVQSMVTLFSAVGAGTVLGAYRAAVVADLSFEGVECQVIGPQRWAKRAGGLLVNGQIEGDGMPANVAWDILRQTDRVRAKGDANHRGGVGTLHIPGIPRAEVNGNDLSNAFRTGEAQTLRTELLGLRTVAGKVLMPVIWHRSATVAPFVDPLSGSLVGPYIRTMRRRGSLLGI